ncbi:flavin-dependent oxidoreductase [Acidimangrovimonas pyrenivorans]|uniref:Flavin-dependent oxidoreductase n=1 Tax=Acidimangrovimonas pyrenivorans TaxID=2030798 RepID=A0ABV7AFW5_9RHOB
MTVLIAGAGIGGLSLGLTLHRLGIPFRIFEAVRQLAPLGLGINLQPHAVRELVEMGFGPGLDKIGLRTGQVGYYNDYGQEIWTEPRGAAAGYNWPQFSIHRGELQMMLFRAVVSRAGPKVLRCGLALDGWEETQEGVRIRLRERDSGKPAGTADGTLLVAADGINSAARARLFPDEGPAQWGGTVMWRGVTEGPRFLGGRTMAMAGTKARKFVCYPIADLGADRSLINWIADLGKPEDYLWARQDWTREGRRADFADEFADWHFPWLDIPKVIADASEIWEYPMVDREPLPRWRHGPVTLLGDAAHAMYPIGSNGASQAILDARYLGRALRDHGVGTAALDAYEDERREAMNALVLTNRGDGPDKILDIVHDRAPEGFDDIETVMPLAERRAFAEGYKKIAGMEITALNARPPVLAG